MKVLEPGNKYIMEVRCTGHGNGGHGCNALLGLERSDLRYYPGVPGNGWGSRDPAVSFRCVECGEITDLKSEEWPARAPTLQSYTKAWAEGKTDV